MAVSKVVTTVVDVGQGQCTFVEIYDDSTPPALINTLLFDCGTSKPSDYTNQNINYIAAVIKGMATPKIDLVVFSHGDSDHINLCYLLLSNFPLPQPRPLIGEVRYGGAWESYEKTPGTFAKIHVPDPGEGNRNILTYVQNNYVAAAQNIRSVDPDYSQYTEGATGTAAPIFQTAGQEVKVHVVIGNVLNDSTIPWEDLTQAQINALLNAGANPRNRSSIVCSLTHAENGPVIICGDAINRTMAQANQHFPGTPQNPTALMITLPHHGSRSTGLGGSPTATDTLQFFARTWSAKTFTASAFAQYGHPSAELAGYFQAVAAPGAMVRDTRLAGNSHLTVAELDVNLTNAAGQNPRTGNYYCISTQSNFFATYYSQPANPDDAVPTRKKRTSNGNAVDAPVPVAPPGAFSYNFQGNNAAPAAGYAGGFVQPINGHACWVYTTLANGDPTLDGYTQLEVDPISFTGPVLPAANTVAVATEAPTPAQSTVPTATGSTLKAPALPGLRRFR